MRMWSLTTCNSGSIVRSRLLSRRRARDQRIPESRPGFSLLEIMIALSIAAALVAVVVVTAKSRLEDAEARALRQSLEAIRDGIGYFRRNVGGYPADLLQLARPPGAPGVSASDICQAALTAPELALWRGPYLAQDVTAAGIQVGMSRILNGLSRDPPNSTTVGDIVITVDSVEMEIADLVEEAVDGDPPDLAAGVVRYVPPTLTYRIRIREC